MTRSSFVFATVAALVLLFAVIEVNAFVGVATVVRSRQAHVLPLRLSPDAAAAIAAASAASKEFGATSPEARVAWDIVEELNSADNSAALGGSLDDECVVDEAAVSAACLEYGEKMDELQSLLAQSTPLAQSLMDVASDVKAIKMNEAVAKPAASSPAVTAALDEAKAMVAEYGADSAEARVAWTELEEIASSGLENAMAPALDSENCAVEASIEACEAIDEVTRMVSK